ncbi:type II toxin-antitoxin system Phd/YefM family antitoxin [Mucisphaera sp.]|uniref:type II toxin-antitoxin system Phd/YefM family antitoxin n=1 Tax=Mucisphaera sp. TaxID=2913024 RepID=UPI003D0E6203
MEWPITEAKSRLSELITRVSEDGPQTIRRRNEGFVVLPERMYEELVGKRLSFKDWLLEGPSLEGLDLKRERGGDRPVDL